MTCAHDPPCADFAAHQKAQRAAWKAACAARAKALRNRRGTRQAPGYRPGMNVRRPDA